MNVDQPWTATGKSTDKQEFPLVSAGPAAGQPVLRIDINAHTLSQCEVVNIIGHQYMLRKTDQCV